MKRRVVVTGLGPFCSLGIGIKFIIDSLIRKKTNLKLYKHYINNKLWDSFILHRIQRFNLQDFNIDKSELDFIKRWQNGRIDKDLQYLILGTKLAIDDSGLGKIRNNDKVGIILTHENPGLDTLINKMGTEAFKIINELKKISKKSFLEKLYYSCEKEGYNSQTFTNLFFIAKLFNIHGYSIFINNACASGLYALEAANMQIKNGTNDVVVVAGADCTLSMYKYLWFKKRRFLAEDFISKPFSQDANGIVLGDGGGGILLEELSHAKRRGAHIYAEYLGGSFFLEGWKITLPSISDNNYTNIFKKVLKQSGLQPSDIDLVNPHGVGMRITDKIEASVITKVFGKKNSNPKVCVFKPYVGHTLGGIAVLESIILLLCLENDIIPPFLYTKNIDERIRLRVADETIHRKLRIVAKMSCGFAGYDGVVIFRKPKG
ncbi:hypothetical protein HQ550_04585 [bacterium]|nr:hypothetical protein [bacterium]